MDEQDQQRINEAAQQFSDALVRSSRAAADRGMAAQEINAQLTGDFFKRVIENLRTQAENTRQMGQELAEQQQRAAEAGRTLTQESVRAYMDFVNSMFSFAQGSTQEMPQAGGGPRDFEGRQASEAEIGEDEGSKEGGVEAPSSEETHPSSSSGDTAPPVKEEEEVSEEDAAPAAGLEASPGGGEQEEK